MAQDESTTEMISDVDDTDCVQPADCNFLRIKKSKPASKTTNDKATYPLWQPIFKLESSDPALPNAPLFPNAHPRRTKHADLKKAVIDAAIASSHHRLHHHSDRSHSPIVLDAKFILDHTMADSPVLVTALDITGQVIQSVSEEDLAQFSSIRILRAAENSGLSFEAVAALSGLWQLQMPCCQIASISPSLGAKFEQLEILDLSFNHLKSPCLSSLSGLTSLKQLDLTCNDISQIPKTIAAGFPKLQSLILEKNSIALEQDLQTLGQLPSLQILNLSGNRIKSLSLFSRDSEAFPSQKYPGFPQLCDLDIRGNRLETAESVMPIVYLPVLKHVRLENNPCMRNQTISIVVKSDKTSTDNSELLGYANFDVIKVLRESYGISVGQEIRETEAIHTVTELNVDLWSNNVKAEVMADQVDATSPDDDLNDQELMDMANQVLKSGKMPRLRDLRRILESRKRKREQDTPTPATLKYEPTLQDATFVTHVHIEEERPQVSAAAEEDDVAFDSDDSDTSSTESLDLQMPQGILASVRALRHALSHPNAYIRMAKMSFSKPTQSWNQHHPKTLLRPTSPAASPHTKPSGPAIILNHRRKSNVGHKQDESIEGREEGCIQPASSMWNTVADDREKPRAFAPKRQQQLKPIKARQVKEALQKKAKVIRSRPLETKDMVEQFSQVEKKLRKLALDIAETIGDGADESLEDQ
ncbi:hypothetical protein SmJEL517_g05561 [Synchytrium microbalum]|uniref:Uncharacterized protein n=1 Tax=Synchytrium microbalum TaxID=1806994 RepID=A0A507C0B4_9FUNG|nr:uncharacterized protein SmJEL517_g05561 [Synchytrium microbalum]TPX31025.1 hypothetical protein SmJEL517_g05561 [Synchytrium microbalum]